MTIKTWEALVSHVNQGNTVKYLMFWGHQKSKSGISKSCFSQWYESDFESNGLRYLTAEQFMMAKKAELFGDSESLQKILASTHPAEAKKLGRHVAGFDEEIWGQKRFEIVVEANTEKFSQNSDLKDFLLGTGERILVEASPVDRIWGIGLAADNVDAENPNKWRGLNLLGFALMQVRDVLANA